MIYEYFFPDYSYKTVGDINVGELYRLGIRYAWLDIDNTLVPYTSSEPDANALGFLKSLEEKYSEIERRLKGKTDRFRRKPRTCSRLCA